jgi:hypothetical protein
MRKGAQSRKAGVIRKRSSRRQSRTFESAVTFLVSKSNFFESALLSSPRAEFSAAATAGFARSIFQRASESFLSSASRIMEFTLPTIVGVALKRTSW